MKLKTIPFLLFLFVVNSISAQSVFDKWPEMKSFHEVMSQTFHPAEEGNLEPIKTRSDELMNKAAYLLKSNIPEEFRTKAILDTLEKMQLESKSLNSLVVAKAKDEEIFNSLSGVHDTFHEIVGLCMH